MRTLLVLAHDADPPDALVGEVWHELRRTRSAARSGDVVRATGPSTGSVTSRFTDATGSPPKTVARLLRFEHAGRAASAGRRGLAHLIQPCDLAIAIACAFDPAPSLAVAAPT